jgi:hypothetical protein
MHNNNKGYVGKHDLHLRLSIDLLKRIDEFATTFNQATRTIAIIQLLEIGLSIAYNLGKINNPEIVDQLSVKFKEGQLVDWIRDLDHKQLETVYSILKTEYDERLNKSPKWMSVRK